jgi:hypothetical protein
MRKTPLPWLPWFATLFLVACGGGLQVGGDLSSAGARGSSSARSSGPASNGAGLGGTLRLHPEVCKEEALKPDFGRLDEDSFVAFLRAHGVEGVRRIRARNDLVYVDVGQGEKAVRFRIAILKSPEEAGNELHEAMLEHGPGSWGVHRSNLAVLAPSASLEDVLSFVNDTKLACWGVLTFAGLDDTFVIPGGYTEL